MRILLLILLMGSINIQPITAEQKKAFEDTSPDLLLWGQGGSGKTEVGAKKAILIGCMYENNRIFLIRRKKVDLRTSLWKRFTDTILPESIVAKNEQTMYYRLKNKTEIWGFGLDSMSDINKIASTECGLAVVEEATEIDGKYYDEKIKRAVRYPGVPFHQTITMCNPASPSHWIYDRWFMKKLKGYTQIFMKTLPPPYLPKSYYAWLKGLTGIFAQRYREGKWVGVEGLVYPFDPRKHIIPRFEIPDDWEKFMAIDFGFAVTHPFVCQWWAVSPEGKFYRYREIHMSQRTVKTHSKEIIKFCETDKMSPFAVCDHDAEDRATLEENGLIVQAANKERLAGQQTVHDLFEHDRIYFMEDSLVEVDQSREIRKLPIMTEQEFGTYMWATKGKEDMIKTKDDGMDGMRYGLHTHEKAGLGGPQVRFL